MQKLKHPFGFGTSTLNYSSAIGLVRKLHSGIFYPASEQKIQESAQFVAEKAASDIPYYGINTGFGPLCTTKISAKETRQLQTNILLSHSTGLGKPLTSDLVRLMLVLKIHGLAMGYSGIRLETLKRLLWHLDTDVLPYVPSQGSVGASGKWSSMDIAEFNPK